ncbi:MAG: hypothetical protein LBE27_07305 [Deltaproteobacteria bacterium]|jgi:hypothetical protein|nr:hypothetical protein [Deltaproteobacteria bacterium]
MTAKNIEGDIFKEINPGTVSGADIVLGILSHNDMDNIELSLEKAVGGLKKYYPDMTSVVVNSDCCSDDNTRELFLGTKTEVPKIYVSTPPDKNIKRASFFNLMVVAERMAPKVVLAIDARISTVKMSWVPRLADPILKNGASYTAPIYSRQFFDTPVTFLLTYPMFRAIFGRRIRHPNLGDAAFSGALNDILLHKTTWPSEESYAACELTMQVIAVSHGPVFQSFMGDPRVGHIRRPIDADITEEFYSNLMTLYELMILYPKLWLKVKNSRPTPILGADLKPEILAPREMTISTAIAQSMIQNITKEAEPFWSKYFTEYLPLLEDLRHKPLDSMEIAPELWVKIIYKGALVFRSISDAERSLLVRSLVPLFLVRLFKFHKMTCSLTSGQLIAMTEDEALLFEKFKPDLVFSWRSMDSKI